MEENTKQLFLSLIKRLNNNPNDTIKFLESFEGSKTFNVLDCREANDVEIYLFIKLTELAKNISPQKLERLVIMQKENVNNSSTVIMVAIEKVTLVKFTKIYDYEPQLFMFI